MNKTDYLYHDQMITKCNSAITLLNQDIADNLALKRKLNSIIKDGKLKGQSIAALKDNLRDYFVCIGLILSADKSDKNDLERLKSKLASQTDYDGPLIWKHFEEARAKMNTAEATASDFRTKERLYSPPWYYDEELDKWLQSDDPNPYTSKVRHYEDIADTERKIMEAAQRKMKEFDSFATDTMGYLSAGKEIRKTVSEAFTLMKTQKEGGIYSPGVAKVYLNKLLLSDNSYLKKIARDIKESEEYKDYLIDSKYYEDEEELESINSQINTYYNMINSGNTAAIEAAKKNIDIDSLNKKKKELIKSILSKTEHSEFFLDGFEFACLKGYSTDQLEELMWNWLTIDDEDLSNCCSVPESWMEEINDNYEMAKWTAINNPGASYEYFEKCADYYMFSNMITGVGKNKLFTEFNRFLASKVSQNELCTSFIYNGWYQYVFLDSIKENVSLKDWANNLLAFKRSADTITSDADLNIKLLEGALLETTFVILSVDKIFRTSPLEFIAHKENNEDKLIEIAKSAASTAFSELKDRALVLVEGLPGEDVNRLYNLEAGIPLLNTLSSSQREEQALQNKKAWATYKDDILNNNNRNKIYVSVNGGKIEAIKDNTMPHSDGKFYIEHQDDFVDKLLYGKKIGKISEWFMTDKYDDNGNLYGSGNTCELIAIYNVMTFNEDEEVDFSKLVKDFSAKAPALGGNFGTSPDMIKEYLEIHDYTVDEIDIENLGIEKCEELLEKYDSFIMSDWNSTTAEDAMHTMAITIEKSEENGSPVYNIVRHNDNYCYYDENQDVILPGYTTKDSGAGLYELLCEYTSNKDNLNDKVSDGTIKIWGIVK